MLMIVSVVSVTVIMNTPKVLSDNFLDQEEAHDTRDDN